MRDDLDFAFPLMAARAADEFARHWPDRLRPRPSRGASNEDVARMIREFTAAGGRITACPPAYAARSDQYRI